jgi:hypothetical protein
MKSEHVRIAYQDFEEVVFLISFPEGHETNFNSDLVKVGRHICSDTFICDSREMFQELIVEWFTDRGYTTISI